MNRITSETTVGEIVRALPARSRIFEKLGIDYCCGGKKSLIEACRGKGLDAATVIAMLTALDAAADHSPADADAMGLAELCDHIERAHHDYLRDELPRLDFMTRKVAAVHGDHEPRLRAVRGVFESFNAEMLAHTGEEEEVVFPKIRQLEGKNGGKPGIAADLKSAVLKLESEHESAGSALARFRELTDDYTPPDWPAILFGRSMTVCAGWKRTCTSTSMKRTTCSSQRCCHSRDVFGFGNRQTEEPHSMKAMNPDTPLGQILLERPEYGSVLEKLGIDPTRDAANPFGELCRARGLEANTAARMLAAFRDAARPAPAVCLELMTLTELCDHLGEAHRIIYHELQVLDRLTGRMAREHAAAHPDVLAVRKSFLDFQRRFKAHLRRESDGLFASIRGAEAGGNETRRRRSRIGLPSPVAQLEREHLYADEALGELRSLVAETAPCSSATAAIRTISEAIARLERAIHEQIYKESQLLFPKVIAR